MVSVDLWCPFLKMWNFLLLINTESKRTDQTVHIIEVSVLWMTEKLIHFELTTISLVCACHFVSLDKET